jgi:hypothetical protein
MVIWGRDDLGAKYPEGTRIELPLLVNHRTQDRHAYLREAYHGEPYATRVLVPESFETGRAAIPAATLWDRLGETLKTAERRERELYGETDINAIGRVLKSYVDFVGLCAEKEDETGAPCLIIASY